MQILAANYWYLHNTMIASLCQFSYRHHVIYINIIVDCFDFRTGFLNQYYLYNNFSSFTCYNLISYINFNCKSKYIKINFEHETSIDDFINRVVWFA